MSIDWFRSWHGAPTDNKWLVIGRRANTSPGIVAAIVWALLDHASQCAKRGSVADFDVETYAAFSGFTEETVRAVVAALVDKGIIKPDQTFNAWDKRQPKREDDKSTDRVRAYRERMKRNETHGNVVELSGTLDKIREDKDTDNKGALSRVRLIEKMIFPSDGSVEYSRWAGLSRTHCPGKDPDHVASLFRGFCQHQGIPFDRSGIEQTFISFCKTASRKRATA